MTPFPESHQPGNEPHGDQPTGYDPYGFDEQVHQSEKLRKERQLLSVMHFANVLVLLGPLICWLLMRERGEDFDREGKEATNWGITAAIIGFSFGFFALLLGWIPILGPIMTTLLSTVLSLGLIAMAVWAGVRTLSDGKFVYPVAFRFIK